MNSGEAVMGASATVKGVSPENSDGNTLLIDYEQATNSNGIAFFNLLVNIFFFKSTKLIFFLTD